MIQVATQRAYSGQAGHRVLYHACAAYATAVGSSQDIPQPLHETINHKHTDQGGLYMDAATSMAAATLALSLVSIGHQSIQLTSQVDFAAAL
jgi:hypothetical protein